MLRRAPSYRPPFPLEFFPFKQLPLQTPRKREPTNCCRRPECRLLQVPARSRVRGRRDRAESAIVALPVDSCAFLLPGGWWAAQIYALASCRVLTKPAPGAFGWFSANTQHEQFMTLHVLPHRRGCCVCTCRPRCFDGTPLQRIQLARLPAGMLSARSRDRAIARPIATLHFCRCHLSLPLVSY